MSRPVYRKQMLCSRHVPLAEPKTFEGVLAEGAVSTASCWIIQSSSINYHGICQSSATMASCNFLTYMTLLLCLRGIESIPGGHKTHRLIDHQVHVRRSSLRVETYQVVAALTSQLAIETLFSV